MNEIRERVSVNDTLRAIAGFRESASLPISKNGLPGLTTWGFRIPANAITWNPVHWDSLRPYFEHIDIETMKIINSI